MVRRSGGTSILRATVSAIIKCQGSFFSYFIVRLKSETIVHPLCITNIISYLMWSQNDAKEDDVWNIPIATYFIVTVCKVLLAASMWMNEWKFEPMSENPTLGPSAQVLIKLGAKDTDLIVLTMVNIIASSLLCSYMLGWFTMHSTCLASWPLVGLLN